VVYTWNQGDGGADVNTTTIPRSMTWATKGTYNLTVTTTNPVSFKTNVTEVIVQDEITGVTLTAPVAPKGEAHSITVSFLHLGFPLNY
jgi:carbohydrate-binding DOMON domain-containing protein